jgi:hypothetical protein
MLVNLYSEKYDFLSHFVPPIALCAVAAGFALHEIAARGFLLLKRFRFVKQENSCYFFNDEKVTKKSPLAAVAFRAYISYRY